MITILSYRRLARSCLFADPDADRRDDAPNFLVGQHLVLAALVGVDDLAAERQDRLILADDALPPALPPALSPSTRYSSHRATSRLVQSRSLPGRPPPESAPLRSRRSWLRFFSSLTGFGGKLTFLHDLLGALRDSPRDTWQRKSPTAELMIPSTSPLPSLVLVCPSNCGCGTRHADHRREALRAGLHPWARDPCKSPAFLP